MPAEVNAAAVQQSNVSLPGEISPAQASEKSAEIIVIEETSRSAKLHSKVAGEIDSAALRPSSQATHNANALSRKGVHPMKDRTNEEGIDLATDKPTDNARRRGELESRSEGKHGAPQERNMIEEILEPECPKGSVSDIFKNAKPSRTDGA